MDRMEQEKILNMCDKNGIMYTGCVKRKACVDFCEAIKKSNIDMVLMEIKNEDNL